MTTSAEHDGSGTGKTVRRIGPDLRGALIAIFAPLPFLALLGLLISWKETFPNAHTQTEAVLQAVTYIPGMVLMDLIGAIFTSPAIAAWVVLRRRGWAPWYVCMSLGLATGWLMITLISTGASAFVDSKFYRQMQIEFVATGLLTGLAVWLAARTTHVRLRF